MKLGVCHAVYVATVYSEMREEEVAQAVPHSYTTARTLLSILRLSQALARLRFAENVDQVCTALQLLASMASTHQQTLCVRPYIPHDNQCLTLLCVSPGASSSDLKDAQSGITYFTASPSYVMQH